MTLIAILINLIVVILGIKVAKALLPLIINLINKLTLLCR